MLRRNVLIVVLAVVLVASGVVAVLLLRRSTPPQAMRLLPAADAYVYLDLRPLRAAGAFKQMVSPDSDYARFVQDTGFQFERDLDQATLAVHLANTGDGGEARYSEVFVGRFNQPKLTAYLRKTAASSRAYRDTTVYAIPLPGRTVHVAVLNRNLVAASNTDGESAILGMIDRYRQTFGMGGSELLRRYYPRVPLASVAWAVARTASAGEQGNSKFVLPGGFDVFLPPETVVVAAVRYLGSVQLRADAFTPTQEDARQLSDQLNAFVALARTVELHAQASSDPDLKAFFDSVSISQLPDRAQLSATIPPGFLKKIVSETPPSQLLATPTSREGKSTTETQRHRETKKK